MRMRLIAIAIAMPALTLQSCSSGFEDPCKDLAKLVGHKVTLKGVFHSSGWQGPEVTLDDEDKPGCMVYLKAQLADSSGRVVVTGTRVGWNRLLGVDADPRDWKFSGYGSVAQSTSDLERQQRVLDTLPFKSGDRISLTGILCCNDQLWSGFPPRDGVRHYFFNIEHVTITRLSN